MDSRDDIISRVNAGSKGGSSESQDADFTRSLPQGPSGTLNPTSFGEEPSSSSQSSTERRCKECMENT